MSKGIPVIGLILGCHAERVGVRKGDQLMVVNGIAVNGMDDFISAIKLDTSTRKVVVEREGVLLEFEMIVGKHVFSQGN